MNKLLAVTVGLVLAATAAQAGAQDRSRRRDDGGSPQYQEQRAQQSSDRGGSRSYEGGGSNHGPRGFSGPRAAHDNGGRGGRSYSGSEREVERLSGGGAYSAPQQSGYQGGGDHRGGRSGRGDWYRDGRGGRDGYHGGRDGYHGGHDGWRTERHRGDRGHWNGHHGGHHNWRRGNYWGSHRHHHRYRSPWRYIYPRGYYASYWDIGYRIPSAFYAPRYYIDYRPYGLAPPPYGYAWIRVDGDVLLVELATGLIADIIEGLYY